MTKPGGIRWGAVTIAVALTIGTLVVTGALGWWQWNRASSQGEIIHTDPPVPIADLVAPAQRSGPEVGRDVNVAGTFADDAVALVPGREIDGVEAVVVVRPFTVDASATGTGDSATLAVIVGWVAPDHVDSIGAATSGQHTVRGYLRASEGAEPRDHGLGEAPDGAFWADGISTAQFAQEWPSPLYSAVLVSETIEDGMSALPARAEERSIEFRNVAYAIEWWLFGAFFVYLAGRWIRDNGRSAPADVPIDIAPQG